MDFLRNLPTQQPQQLTQLIQIQPGRVVSMAMSRQEHCQMTLLAFGDGESISEECYFPRSSCSGWLQAAADHAFIMI